MALNLRSIALQLCYCRPHIGCIYVVFRLQICGFVLGSEHRDLGFEPSGLNSRTFWHPLHNALHYTMYTLFAVCHLLSEYVNVWHVFLMHILFALYRIPHHKRGDLTENVGQEDFIVAEWRFRMAGHILRLPEERPAKIAMTWTQSERRRGRGWPKETWRRTFCKDLARVDITWEECATVAADRSSWRQLAAAQCAKPHGRN